MVLGLEQTLLQRQRTDGPVHMTRCSMSLIIREMQIKTTMGYHLTPVRMAIINKSTNDNCGQGVWRKENPWALLAGMRIGAATVENSEEVPQKVKHGTAL